VVERYRTFLVSSRRCRCTTDRLLNPASQPRRRRVGNQDIEVELPPWPLDSLALELTGRPAPEPAMVEIDGVTAQLGATGVQSSRLIERLFSSARRACGSSPHQPIELDWVDVDERKRAAARSTAYLQLFEHMA
jgi:hypothetical protein